MAARLAANRQTRRRPPAQIQSGGRGVQVGLVHAGAGCRRVARGHAQLVELGLKLSHNDSTAWKHGYTLAMAAGPWRGFAKEWLEANKKIKSERTQLIEYSSKVFGVSVDEDLEKAHKDDAAADKVEPAAPANDL